VPLSQGNSAVLAHGKECGESGGWVLLRDGTVKEMSASEFQNAPKSKK
jgi:hypothetical protein